MMLKQQQRTIGRHIVSCIRQYSRNTINCQKANTNIQIPDGLSYYSNYLHQHQYDELNGQLDVFHNQCRIASSAQMTQQGTMIPQPKEVQSQSHNLPSTELFKNIVISDGEQRVKGEYFEKYGDEGHELIYFQGNHNLPAFAIALIACGNLDHKARELLLEYSGNNQMTDKKELYWKMTLNYYTKKEIDGDEQWPGFPFHVDIASNGDVTFIMSMGAPAIMEFKAKESNTDNVHRVLLEPNSLVAIAGDARWNWMHRVVPTGNKFEHDGKAYLRMNERKSIVFGCRFK